MLVMLMMALRCPGFGTTSAQNPLWMPISHADSKDDPEDGQNGQENGDDDFFVTVWWRHRYVRCRRIVRHFPFQLFFRCVLLRSPCFYYVCLYFAALGVKRGRRCAIESSFVLSSCWPLYLVLFFSFFQFARKWNVDRRAMFYNLGGGQEREE